MNLLAVSDLHLGPSSDHLNKSFLQFLDTALQNQDQILIVGDLFDLWFGQPELTFPYQITILKKMRDLASMGLIMNYVEGNRDFGIRKLEGRIFQKVSPVSLRMKWGNRWIHAEHGDLINLDDKPYRFWRGVSKSQGSFFLLDHLPSWILLRTAVFLEKKLRATNMKNKSRYPEEFSRIFYEAQFTEGADVVVVGHFHEQRELQVTTDRGNMLFYNLPGWESGFRYLVIPQTNEKPYFMELK